MIVFVYMLCEYTGENVNNERIRSAWPIFVNTS